MAEDAVVRIGAVFDKTNVEEGITSTTELINKSNQSISPIVEETSARTTSAYMNMSAAAKELANNVSASAIRQAEAMKGIVVAQADVRRSWVLVKDASLPAEESIRRLAASQQLLTAAQAEGAAAVKAAAAEMAASAPPVAAAWTVAGAEVKAALTGMQAKFAATAETSKISAAGIGAGFAGLSSLMGAGILAGFAAHFIDDAVKVNVELGHMAEETGFTFERMAGLRQMAKELGMDLDTLARSLFHMNAVQYEANHGSDKLKQAFLDLDVTEEQLKNDSPEEMLQHLAIGMQKYAGSTMEANAVREIFSRGGVKLIPLLEAEGANLLRDADAAGKKTGADKEANAASLEWTKNLAQLSGELMALGNAIIENLHYVEAFGAAIGSYLNVAFQAVYASIKETIQALKGLGQLMIDAVTGHWRDMPKDWQAANDAMVATTGKALDDIKARWKEVDDLAKGPLKSDGNAPKPSHGGKKDENPEAAGAAGGGKGGTQAAGPEIQTLAATSVLDQNQDKGLAQTVWDVQAAKGAQAQIAAFFKDYNKAAADAAKRAVESERSAAEEKIRIGLKDLEDFEEDCRFKVRMGEMSERQMLAAVEAAAKKEEQIRRQQSTVIEGLDRNNEKRFAEDLKKEEQDTREFTKHITQLHQQAALKIKTEWDKATKQFNTAFTTAFNQIITQSKSVSQAFSEMFNKIILDVADMVVQWLLKEAEKWALLKIMQVMGFTTQKTTEGAANAASATSYAAVAAAAAASTVAGVPIIGPALAVAAAGAMMASMAPYIAIAALGDSGGMIPHGGMMVNLSGAAERTLDPRQTANFDKMVSNNSSSSSSSSANTTHNHITQNLNGYDRAGMKAALRGHADEILDIVRGGYRSGALTA